jgi:hypothetical protein
MNKIALLATVVLSMAILGQILPHARPIHVEGLKVEQIDQAFFRDLEQYRRSAAARRHHTPSAPVTLTGMTAVDADRG